MRVHYVNVTTLAGWRPDPGGTAWQLPATRTRPTGPSSDGPGALPGPYTLENLAGRGEDGELLVFTRSMAFGWFAENVSQVTGRKIGGPATSWQTYDGDDIVEHLAGPDRGGSLVVSYRTPVRNWTSVDVTEITGRRISSAVTSWQTSNGPLVVEHLAGLAPADDPLGVSHERNLLVFWWSPGQDWQATDVSNITGRKVASAVISWQSSDGAVNVENLAGVGPDDHLLHFFWSPTHDWQVTDLSAATGQSVAQTPRRLLTCPITTWRTLEGFSLTDHLAVTSPGGDLLVFSLVAGQLSRVRNLSEITGQKVSGAVTSWQTLNGVMTVEHLIAEGAGGSPIIFWRARDTDWRAVNMTDLTGEKLFGPYTVWKTQQPPQSVHEARHLAGTTANGDLVVLTWALGIPPEPLSGYLGQACGCRDGGTHNLYRQLPAWTPVQGSDLLVEGEVYRSIVSHEDFPYTHDSHDSNFNVKLDMPYEGFQSDRNRRRPEDGSLLMEMEWEINYFPPAFWAWPGDRVSVWGRLIFDCGHPFYDGGRPYYENEIHPPFATAFTRPHIVPFAGDTAPSVTNRTYFYVYGRGGYFNAEDEVCLRRDYEFDIPLPPQPSPAAVAHAEVAELPLDGPWPSLTPLPAADPPRVHVRVPLAPTTMRYLFTWDELLRQQTPGDAVQSARLVDFLRQSFGLTPDQLPIAWVEELEAGRVLQITNKSPGEIVDEAFFITLDATFSTATVHRLTGSRGQHFLQTRVTDGRIDVYDYDPQDQKGLQYGAIITSGWRETSPTHNMRHLRVTFDSVRINNNHHVPIGPETTTWRLWVAVNGVWIEVAGLNNLSNGDTVQIGRSVDVIVPEDGSIPLVLRSTGWVVGAIDRLFGVRELPDDLELFWEFIFGDLGEVPPRATQPIGIIDKQHTREDNWGTTQPQNVPAVRNPEASSPGLGGDTEADFTLSYRVQSTA